ncbi:hypothetical protein G7Y89_g13796 [Cudoniella acicularis]|uniref:Voltage-gated hydrogen channel 1 n=1 Tax=Cudoniella acicularis TaxID=354080 RepID=A0A8H4R6S8_9HELO|nr:hypothetical protein G7Y89_g13796 [Cudoniella acicularis]
MPSEASSSTQPLLSDANAANDDPSRYSFSAYEGSWTSRLTKVHNVCRGEVKEFLSSRAQHFTVLGLVSFDLLGIFADIIINLYQCDEGDTSPAWNDVRNGLGIAGLVFSCLFMLELVFSIWAFGWRYFQSWFHCFDAAVIFAGFVVDVLLHGVLEEVVSLVVVLRLWRFFKIIEEFSVGAEEQMDGLELRIEQLELENEDLKRELKKRKGTSDEEDEVGFAGGSHTFN